MSLGGEKSVLLVQQTMSELLRNYSWEFVMLTPKKAIGDKKYAVIYFLNY